MLKKIGLLICIVLFLCVGVSQISAELNQGKIDLKIEDSVMKELNQLYYLTDKNTEFLGTFDIIDGEIRNFMLVGYKDLKTNETTLINSVNNLSNTIHSHPVLGYLSEQDKISDGEVACVMHGIEKVSCFEIIPN